MIVTELKLPKVKIIEPDYFKDHRGYYCETFSVRTLKREASIENTFVQDNHSMTFNAGTIRGIHFQLNPKPQAKLVRCTKGKVLDVVVDLRSDSDTFKDWISIELSDENKKQIWIPNGFGHGFLTLTDKATILYQINAPYIKSKQSGFLWNDPLLNIKWPTKPKVISYRDKNFKKIKQ